MGKLCGSCSKPKVNSPPPSPASPPSTHQEMTIKLHENGFSTNEARFAVRGRKHRVSIRFVGMETIKLFIDGSLRHSVENTHWNIRGHEELVVDGKSVDFAWDLNRSPVKFTFRTRAGRGCGVPWDQIEESYRLTILGEVPER